MTIGKLSGQCDFGQKGQSYCNQRGQSCVAKRVKVAWLFQLGTSISFAQSAGQQVAMDVTRGLLQGTSGYLAKKFRTVKVKLKAGYRVMLYAKQQ